MVEPSLRSKVFDWMNGFFFFFNEPTDFVDNLILVHNRIRHRKHANCAASIHAILRHMCADASSWCMFVELSFVYSTQSRKSFSVLPLPLLRFSRFFPSPLFFFRHPSES